MSRQQHLQQNLTPAGTDREIRGAEPSIGWRKDASLARQWETSDRACGDNFPRDPRHESCGKHVPVSGHFLTKSPANFTQVSAEVFYSDGGFTSIDNKVIDMLKAQALLSPRKRCRLCLHANPEESQQEMVIVMNRQSYVRPHRHFDKVETLAVIEGLASTVLFDDAGNVDRVIPMSPNGVSGSFFYRMPKGLFHTLIFHSEWLVFIETTIGPFRPDQTESAQWAPAESDAVAGHAYLGSIHIAANALAPE